MRYLVWDDGHNRLAGVFALGDPVYNLSVRDTKIGWSVHDRAQRLVGLLDAYTGPRRGDTSIRYAVVATLRTAVNVDLYTPISTSIQPEVAPEIAIEV
jgi:hypothetical protein